MLANAASKCFKKNSQLSLHLISTIKIGTRNKPLLPSKEMAASKTPSSDPLRWQPSIPKNGLHPPRKSFFIPLKHKKNLFEVYFIVMLGHHTESILYWQIWFPYHISIRWYFLIRPSLVSIILFSVFSLCSV